MSRVLYYPKIDTLWERGEDFGVSVGNWKQPEFEFITEWDFYEKVDGMNVSLVYDRTVPWPETSMSYNVRGRGESTNWRADQLSYLRDTALTVADYVQSQMNEHGLTKYEIFGELFGPGIQKGGVYGDSIKFMMFDIRVDESVWLDMPTLEGISFDTGIRTAPLLGRDTAWKISGAVSQGIESAIVEGYVMEGIVARPPVRLYDTRGKRVMFKLKTKDFKQLTTA